MSESTMASGFVNREKPLVPGENDRMPPPDIWEGRQQQDHGRKNRFLVDDTGGTATKGK
jgi:hypothetical protein